MAGTEDRRLWITLALRVVLPSALCIVLFSAAIFVVILPAFERGLLARKQEMLRYLGQTACGILQGYDARAQAGEFTVEEAQTRALVHLRRLRYGDEGKDYFWINDLHPRMIMHPYQPELEGQDLTNYRDPQGKPLFVAAVDAVRREGAGYVTYMWQWKDDPSRVVPKLSYVREFAPWGWVVGTGVYLEDVAVETRAITRKLTLAATLVLGIVALLSSCVIWQNYQSERRRRRAEQERREIQEQLHQAQKMEAVGQLAAGAAHDFNNLLTVIAGNLEPIALALPADQAAAAALAAVNHAVEQAGGLTRSLLTFGRNVPTDKKPLDLCAAVDNAAHLLRRTLPKTIKLCVDAEASPAPWIRADATQLQQVVLNLALNARDAMPRGGTLRIAVSRVAPATGTAEESVQGIASSHLAARDSGPGRAGSAPAFLARLEVSDTGSGIAPRIRDRIFEPFFTTKERGEGTGLGLAVVHGIIEDHGGQIEVRSEVGVGTTFIVTFPCVAPPVSDDAETPVRPPSPGHGELLLLAEANQQAREIMAAELRTLGYRILVAADGPAALEEHRRHRGRLRLLIVDVDLLEGGGAEWVRTVRREDEHMPLILTAGSPLGEHKDLQDPAVAVLYRPYQLGELDRLVSAMLMLEPAADAGR